MKIGKVTLSKIGSTCLIVNGIILLLYALLVPTFERGVHWLITLVAILFLAAISSIYHSMGKTHKVAAKVVAVLFAFGMIVIIAADLLFTLSFLTRLPHDLAYALGNAVFVIGVLFFGLITLKAAHYKWVAYLSTITGIIGLATYLPLSLTFLPTISLLLLGLWSLGVGFKLRKFGK